MLSVTDEALRHMADLLDSNEAPDEAVVRCVVEDGSVTLVPGIEEPGDTVFRLEDKAIFVVSGEISVALADFEFAVQPTDEGPQLTLRENDAA